LDFSVDLAEGEVIQFHGSGKALGFSKRLWPLGTMAEFLLDTV